MDYPFVYTNGCIIRIYEWVVHSYLQMNVSFVATNGTVIKRTGNNSASFVDTNDLYMKRCGKESECM